MSSISWLWIFSKLGGQNQCGPGPSTKLHLSCEELQHRDGNKWWGRYTDPERNETDHWLWRRLCQRAAGLKYCGGKSCSISASKKVCSNMIIINGPFFSSKALNGLSSNKQLK